MPRVMTTTTTVLGLLLLPGAALAADTSAPTITIASPANYAAYAVNQSAVAQYTCSDADGPKDVKTCAGSTSSGGSVPNGGAIPTSKSGGNTFTVSATDKAGNKATLTVNYKVNCTGCGAPPPTPRPPSLGATAPSAGTQGSDVVVDPGNSVSCPAGGDPCTTDVTATSGKTVLGRGHFRTASGRHAKLRFKLSAAGARLLRQHHTLHVTFTIVSRAGKSSIRATRTVPLRAP